MDIRKFLPSKRRVCEDQDDNSESESDSGMVEHEEMPDIATTSKSSKALSVKAAQKKAYKSKLTYRCQWESKYPWVYCNDTDIFVAFVKHMASHLQLLVEGGQYEELLTGIMQLNCSSYTMNPNGTKTRL